VQVYIATLVIYCGIDLLSAWSVNLQFAYGGVPNFAYIIFVAVGAYVDGTTTLGSAQAGQSYVLGYHLSFPFPLIAGMVAGGALAAVVGMFTLRSSLRRDYQAAIMFIVGVIALAVVSTATNIFNGSEGIAGLNPPFTSHFSANGYNWAYAGWVWAFCVVFYFVVERLCRSGWGRALRASRDNGTAAASIGLSPSALRMQVFIVGGMIAGLSGGLLIDYIGAWGPSAWGYAETFVFFAAIIVGGPENNRGAIIGTILIPVVFTELPTFFPQIGYQGLTESLQWVIIGIIWIAFIAFRPQGILPSKRVKVARSEADGPRKLSGLRVNPFAERRLYVTPRVSSVLRTDSVAVAAVMGEGTAAALGTNEGAPVSSREPILRVENLGVRFGGVHAVEGVSLDIYAGEITGIIGPNGAGKSSFVSAISGQIKPDEGKVFFDGHNVTKWPLHRRARGGLIRTFQTTSEFGGLTVFENLVVAVLGSEGARLSRAVIGGSHAKGGAEEAWERSWEVLERFEMEHTANMLGSELSGGQRRLLEIMRCLVRRPKLIILDEPMVGIASHLVSEIIEELKIVAAGGVGIVIIEHALEVIGALSDRVVVMAAGAMLADGTYDEVVADRDVQLAYLA